MMQISINDSNIKHFAFQPKGTHTSSNNGISRTKRTHHLINIEMLFVEGNDQTTMGILTRSKTKILGEVRAKHIAIGKVTQEKKLKQKGWLCGDEGKAHQKSSGQTTKGEKQKQNQERGEDEAGAPERE